MSMQRIIVMGSSAGAGKSTFARRLGEILTLPVYHLDVLFWKPGWVESDSDDFVAAQRERAAESRWIFEGNYTDTYAIREAFADTLIYLDVPLSVSLWRVIKRRLLYRRRIRPDIAPGCPEKIDGRFLWFILSTYHRRRPKMAQRIESFRQTGRPAIVLRGQRQQQKFLQEQLRAHHANP